MSEIKANILTDAVPQPEISQLDWASEVRHVAHASFKEQIEDLATRVPEVGRRREDLTIGAAELIEIFQIQPEFFDHPDRTLIFASLASKAGGILKSTGRIDADRAELMRQSQFVTTAAFILTRNHSQAYPHLIEQFGLEKGEGKNIPDGKLVEALCRHEHPEVARDLTHYVERNGVVRETQEKMGINPARAEMPSLHVLSIGQNPLPLAHFDYEKAGLSWPEMLEWITGLGERTEHFVATIPQGDLVSRSEGFVVDTNGKHHVFIPLLKAEVVLAEEQGLPLTEDAQRHVKQSVLSTIRHEYAHTVGEVLVEGEFGKSLEERRAEYYSGDTEEYYYEVKRFFRQMGVISNNYMYEMLDKIADARRNGEELSIYELVANGFGLDKVAEAAAAQPDAYRLFSKNSFVKDMLQALGSYDAIVQRYALEVGREPVVRHFRENLADFKEWSIQDTKFMERQFGTVFNTLGIKLYDVLPEELTNKYRHLLGGIYL